MDPQIAKYRLQHMVAWQTDPQLCDLDIDLLLLAARRPDVNGVMWTDATWTPTYHLDWAAAQAWSWKAGAAVDRYHVVSSGTDLERQQVHQHCLNMEKLYWKRASSQPHVIRVRGQLVDDRTRAYTTVPWWWSEVA